MTFLPIFSAVGSIFNAFSGGQAASNAGEAQANAMNYNAAVANNNAIAAQQAAAANAAQQQRINASKQAKLEAGILHSGVLMEGTPLMLVEEEASQNELETQKILHEGDTRANNYRNQSNLDSYNASVARDAGDARSSGIITGGLFSGIGQIGSSLLKNKN